MVSGSVITYFFYKALGEDLNTTFNKEISFEKRNLKLSFVNSFTATTTATYNTSKCFTYT